MPHLSRIAIYPLKSFEPINVSTASILPNGALEHDRRFALADATGRIINAKRTALVHNLELKLDPLARTLTARHRSATDSVCWSVDHQRDELQQWLSNYLSLDVLLIEEPAGGFPDDDEATGPTIVSRATLQTVADWFELTLDNVRDRFRANLEVDEAEPFWEDRLFRSDSTPQPFRIGNVVLEGINPCRRCVVPTRDPSTGEVFPNFARRFGELRELSLPNWSARERFDHYYRLTTNTRGVGSTGGQIQLGDKIELLSTFAES